MNISTRLHYRIIYLYQRLFVHKIFYRWHRFLFSLIILGLGYNNYQNDQISGEVFAINKVINILAESNKRLVIFDVGAYQGDYSNKLLTNLSNMKISYKIFAFEPNKYSFNKLIKNKFDDRVTVENFALSNKKGTAVLFDYSNNTGSEHASLFAEAINELHKGKSTEIKIKLISLDSYMRQHKIKHIHLLKIDTEGNEYAVLQGGLDALRNGLIDIIQFEFNQMNIYSRVFKKDFVNLLSGYVFFRLLPDGLVRIENYDPLFDEIFIYQNILAVKNELAAKL